MASVNRVYAARLAGLVVLGPDGESVGRVRDVAAPAGYECGHCDKRPICSGCPAIFDLENGAGHIKSKYLCETAQMRYDVIRPEARGGECPNDEAGA